MNLLYFIYRVITSLVFLIFIIPFLLFVILSGRFRTHLFERFGFISRGPVQTPHGPLKIWVHAASLGEVRVANSIITSLKRLVPGCAVTLSTATEHGRALAMGLLGEEARVIYSPVDHFLLVKNALNRIKPDILVFLETEIWPSWIIEAKKKGIKLAILNGRISTRSFRSYTRFLPFFRMVLAQFDLLSMISNGDRERIIQIGARAETVSVNGNSKYDMLIRSTTPGMRENVRRALQIAPDALVIVAGSTRSGEEEILLDAYKRILTPFHDAVLILAPRHLKRVTQITGLVKKKGLKCHLRSELVSQGHTRKERIIIIDCFGELFNTYSAANIAFCGASLVPLGGQNPLEPAAWGTPLFHGPHMEDFSDAMQLLGAYNAGIEVTGAIDLAEKVIFYLNNPDLLAQKGMAAKKALMEGSNVAEVQASLIKGLACKG